MKAAALEYTAVLYSYNSLRNEPSSGLDVPDFDGVVVGHLNEPTAVGHVVIRVAHFQLAAREFAQNTSAV